MGEAFNHIRKGFDATGIKYQVKGDEMMFTSFTLGNTNLNMMLIDGVHGVIVNATQADVPEVEPRLEANVAKLCSIITDHTSRGCAYMDCDLHKVAFRANVLNSDRNPAVAALTCVKAAVALYSVWGDAISKAANGEDPKAVAEAVMAKARSHMTASTDAFGTDRWDDSSSNG